MVTLSCAVAAYLRSLFLPRHKLALEALALRQQLREALPLPCSYRYLLFDRDTKVGGDVVDFLQASAVKPIRTSVRGPWQNGVAERWVGSVRREVLDHLRIPGQLARHDG